VIFEIDEKQMTTDDFLYKLKKRNIQIIGMGQNKLRIVTHMDYTHTMHEAFLDILAKL
jgi:threonine aldolase